jgi:hypothetical protein
MWIVTVREASSFSLCGVGMEASSDVLSSGVYSALVRFDVVTGSELLNDVSQPQLS